MKCTMNLVHGSMVVLLLAAAGGSVEAAIQEVRPPVPVEGDGELLRSICHRLRASQDQLASGVWVADVIKRFAPARMTVEWDGSLKRVEFRIDSWPGDEAGSEGIAVRDRRGQTVFYRDRMDLVSMRGHGRSFPEPLEVEPARLWYFFADTPLSWADFLDPDHPRGNVVRYAVEEDGRLIRITRYHETCGEIFVDVSRDCGMNIVRWTCRTDGNSCFAKEGEIGWKLHADGYWFPEHMKIWTWHVPEQTRPADPELQFVTVQCDLVPVPASRFELRVENLPFGTRICEQDEIGMLVSTSHIGGEAGKLQRDLYLRSLAVRQQRGSTVQGDGK